MKRGVTDFWKRKQYIIAGILVAVAVLGITGIYVATNQKDSKNEVRQEEIAQTKPKAKDVAKDDSTEAETEQTAKASSVIEPKSKDKKNQEDLKPAEEEDIKETGETPEISKKDESAETKEQKTSQTSATTELHFPKDNGLQWPINGTVIMDYSMDKTIYFATLDQYKYNPAVIISGSVNDKVQAAADGKIIDISTNEETGCTVTMDIGDGYTAVYGQLKEVPYHVGAFIEEGNTIGYVGEPTKYYSVEGSNLFFSLKKDDAPIDPVDFFR